MLAFTTIERFTGRRSAAWLMAALAALLAACANDAAAGASAVDIELVDRASGQELPVYTQAGRKYVAGRPGKRYAIRLTNNSGARVLAVLSVDGVNAISGETADPGQVGYVLAPYETYDITGWRKSESTVAAFEFAALRDSYAARTGRPSNVGVVGAAVFLEKVALPVAPLLTPAAPEIPQAPAAATSALADRAEAKSEAYGGLGLDVQGRLGTGHGRREGSVAAHTTFERSSAAPRSIVEIRYDSRENLVAAGIIPGPTRYAQPRSFPNSGCSQMYVPDPPPQ